MTNRSAFALLALIALAGAPAAALAESADAAPNPRIALVIGESNYADHTLATPINDAALIAQTLQAAGYDVVGARDLDEKSLRAAMRGFLAKAAAIGPDMQAFVYLAGRGVQYEGENFFVPVDAQIGRDSDVPIEAVRVADFAHALAAEPGQARIRRSTPPAPIPTPIKVRRSPAGWRWSSRTPVCWSRSTPRPDRQPATRPDPTASTPRRWRARCVRAACRSKTSSPRRGWA